MKTNERISSCTIQAVCRWFKLPRCGIEALFLESLVEIAAAWRYILTASLFDCTFANRGGLDHLGHLSFQVLSPRRHHPGDLDHHGHLTFSAPFAFSQGKVRWHSWSSHSTYLYVLCGDPPRGLGLKRDFSQNRLCCSLNMESDMSVSLYSSRASVAS